MGRCNPATGRLSATLIACALVANVPVAAEEPLPFALTVSVQYGQPLGPESLRHDLQQELAARLRRARCFTTVASDEGGATAPADLLLEVVLDRYREETRYEMTQAQRYDSEGPPRDADSEAVSTSSTVYLQVRRHADSALVRMKRFRHANTRRPFLTEDARLEAYDELIDDVVGQARSYVCGESLEKWEKQIAKAKPASASR